MAGFDSRRNRSSRLGLAYSPRGIRAGEIGKSDGLRFQLDLNALVLIPNLR